MVVPVEITFTYTFNHAFHLRRAHDLWAKAWREMHRLREASTSDHNAQIDPFLNFTVAAWHITDWVWLHLARHPDLQAKLGVTSLRTYQDQVRRESEALMICDVVANGYKHGGNAAPKVGRAETRTAIGAWVPPEQLDSGQSPERWFAIITADGRQYGALEVCQEALAYWSSRWGSLDYLP